MSKTTLVTGGAGFIASTFVRLMLARGISVCVLDKMTYAGHETNLRECDAIAKSNKVNYALVVGDINNPDLVSDLLVAHSVDSVVNFAAESHVDNSIVSPRTFVETNIAGTFTLLDQSLNYFKSLNSEMKDKFRFIQVSTDEVYGSLGEAGRFSETTPYAPNSPYSASKAASDMLARAWFHTYGLPTIVTNCSNNYGPRQFPEKLIPLMITNALKGDALPVYGDGKNVRDWIHVEDHCRGVALALDNGQPGETYCFGGDSERSNLQVVESICRILDQKHPRPDGETHLSSIKFVQDRAGHDLRYAIDDSKASSQLGFSRIHNFESGLISTIDWYLSNPEWTEEVTSSARSKKFPHGELNKY